MKVIVRTFKRNDIPKKVEWINNPANNKYLHYEIPLNVSKTEKWYESHKGDNSRYDGVIEADGVPVGTIGLINIDRKNSKAEYYIAMGETSYKRKGIAKQASRLIIEYGFHSLGLNRIYLFTEVDNLSAQRLFENLGFIREGLIRQDIISRENFVDRFMYGILRKDWTDDCNPEFG